MLQGNILSEILDSDKRYSLEDKNMPRRRPRRQGKISVANDDVMAQSMMAYDADVAYAISIPKAHAVADVDSIMGTSHIEYDIEVTRYVYLFSFIHPCMILAVNSLFSRLYVACSLDACCSLCQNLYM